MTPTHVRGRVTNGVIVPDKETRLPEGASVDIILTSEADYNAEMKAWDRASTHAWAMIEEWEREDAE